MPPDVGGSPGTSPLPQPLTATVFRELCQEYRKLSGFSLVCSDADGNLLFGLPECGKFPCQTPCRDCRKRVLDLALQAGGPVVDRCQEGCALWGLPLLRHRRLEGGLLVVGVDGHGRRFIRDPQEPHFRAACRTLYELAARHGLTGSLSSTHSPHPPHDPMSTPESAAWPALWRLLQEQGAAARSALRGGRPELMPVALDRLAEALGSAGQEQSRWGRGACFALCGSLVWTALEAGAPAGPVLAVAAQASQRCGQSCSGPALATGLREFGQALLEALTQAQPDACAAQLSRGISHLEANLQREIKLAEVARVAGLSASHFSHLLRLKMGRTFTDLLRQYRVDRACQLLAKTNHPVSTIAQECGFCDQSYFTKVFRKYSGQSPLQYRQAQRGPADPAHDSASP